MKAWYCSHPTARPAHRIIVGCSLVLLAAAALVLPVPVNATPAQVTDEVFGDTYVLNWSAGTWSLGGNPVPGCATFDGGVSTGPGDTYHMDSLTCDPTPDAWHWTVTLPSGATLSWGVDNMPTGIQVCADIFYSVGHPALLAHADLAEDLLMIFDEHLHEVLYQGSLSAFDPETEGFVPTQARRCGMIVPLPIGACCFADGTCTVSTEAECASMGGTYQGPETTCEPNPCEQPPMACCYPDGHCEFVTAEICRELGGTPQGYGTTCQPNPCEQPPMACCFLDGHCEFVTAEVCGQLGGEPQGYGTDCDHVICPQPPPTGACCIGEQGNCYILVEADCIDQGGHYQGDDTTCEPVNPCEIVPTRSTTWGKIKSDYR